MRVVRLSGPPSEDDLRAAAACAAGGGTLIFPTETVYGIGCDPENEGAVAAVFAAKRRPPDKPLAVHVAAAGDVLGFVASVPPVARAIMSALWPGPVAIVLRRLPGRARAAARSGPTLSFRCPASEACRAILHATGPLAATSANISGRPAYTGVEDEATLPDATLAIIAGPTSLRRESTVVDCSTGAAEIVRAGAVDPLAIERAVAHAEQFG